MVLGLLVVPVLLGPTVEAQQQQDALEQDTPSLKVDRLQRAIANHGQSPDRVVVVYARDGMQDAERVRARQAAGGQVLHASRPVAARRAAGGGGSSAHIRARCSLDRAS